MRFRDVTTFHFRTDAGASLQSRDFPNTIWPPLHAGEVRACLTIEIHGKMLPRP